MAMTQRDDTIEAIKRLDAYGRLHALRVSRWRISPPKRSFCGASLEYAVMHGDEEEAERIREELRISVLFGEKGDNRCLIWYNPRSFCCPDK